LFHFQPIVAHQSSLAGKRPDYFLKKSINGTDGKLAVVMQNLPLYFLAALLKRIVILMQFVL
jgi:hypothetical protein